MRGSTRGPWHRPRSKRCPETDAQAPRPLPVAREPSIADARHRVRSTSSGPVKGSPPALQPVLVTQRGAGYNGILWVYVGLEAKLWISAVFRKRASAPVPLMFA